MNKGTAKKLPNSLVLFISCMLSHGEGSQRTRSRFYLISVLNAWLFAWPVATCGPSARQPRSRRKTSSLDKEMGLFFNVLRLSPIDLTDLIAFGVATSSLPRGTRLDAAKFWFPRSFQPGACQNNPIRLHGRVRVTHFIAGNHDPL